jgi:hypothetical protein
MRRSTLLVLGLVVLPALALLFHRGPREMKPPRPPKAVAVAEPPAPEPPAVAIEAEPPKREPPRVAPVPPKREELRPVVSEEIKPGTLRGTVKILGVPPKRMKLRIDVDPKCAALHTGDLLADNIVVDPENNVRWAFVYVSKGNTASTPGPLLPVQLDQVGCRFDPHVLGVQVNQPLDIHNNDNLLHNVHSLPFENKEFNFGLPEPGLIETKRFTRKEVMVKIKCDIHPWMSAWVGVLDHPYFSVTSETGGYGIVNLPPGRFRITVWHERYASVEQEVEIPSGGDARLDFFLDAQKSY